MARRHARPAPTKAECLKAARTACPACGRKMWYGYANFRTLVTLDGLVRFKLEIRQCRHAECSRHRRPYRPEAEGALALPHHEFGLDVIAMIGALRYVQHQSVPEIHRTLRARGVDIAERNVTYLLERYDELLALSLSDTERLREITAREGRVILALDGLQPDVGHEVLWILRDCLSGEVLLAKSMLSATAEDLAALLRSVAAVLGVPIVAVVSDGQRSIRRAVEQALPGVPHQLCHFHYLREAALPVYEADRHAKKELKKRVRGIRVIERQVEPRGDAEAEVVRGYCAAVRSALTDDGPRRSAPRGCNCTSGSPRSGTAWRGLRKGGSAEAADQAEDAPRQGVRPDARSLAGCACGLRLGTHRRSYPEQRGGAECSGGPGPPPGPA